MLTEYVEIIFRLNRKSTPKRSVSDISTKYSSLATGIETDAHSSIMQSADQNQNVRKSGNNSSNRPRSGVLHSSDSSSELKRDLFGSLISLNDSSNEMN